MIKKKCGTNNKSDERVIGEILATWLKYFI